MRPLDSAGRPRLRWSFLFVVSLTAAATLTACGHSDARTPPTTSAKTVAIRAAERIGRALPAFSGLSLKSSSAACLIKARSAPLTSIQNEFDYPASGAVRIQVEVSVLVFKDGSTARSWIGLVSGARGHACMKAYNEQRYSSKVKHLRVRVVPGLPSWLGNLQGAYLRGFSLVLTGLRSRLVITKVEVEDRADPRAAVDLAILDLAGVPRALIRRVVIAARG